MPPVTILQVTDLPQEAVDRLAARFDLNRWPATQDERRSFLSSHGPAVRGIATTGKGPIDAAMLDALPNLEIIASYSAGVDGIDTAAAARRGIPVTNTSHILADDVADLALWLLIGAARGLSAADRFVRRGDWSGASFPLGRAIRGLKVGILGLGHIGKALAKRLDAMGAEIAYHGRHEQRDVGYPYQSALEELARWSDALVVSCPGGAATANLVDGRILAALGDDGILVNISRGTVVDEPALVAAVESGRLACAAVDVLANEPQVPAILRTSDRAIVLPHIGSATTQTRRGMGDAMVQALEGHFGGSR